MKQLQIETDKVREDAAALVERTLTETEEKVVQTEQKRSGRISTS